MLANDIVSFEQLGPVCKSCLFDKWDFQMQKLQVCPFTLKDILLRRKNSVISLQIGCAKRKSAFKHAQNAQIQIILHMHRVIKYLLSIDTFCSVKWFC